MLNAYFCHISGFQRIDLISESIPIVRDLEDRKRILQYLNREDRCRALAGQLMLERFINREIKRRDQTGRSIKPNCDGIFFNLTHDEDIVLLVTHANLSVGVDIMNIKLTNPNNTIEEMFNNLRNIFSRNEWEYINRGCDKLKRFYNVWTAKEAYVKCLGTGLYTEPELLETTISDCGRVKIRHRGYEEASSKFECRIYSQAFPGYVMAVCIGPVHLCDTSWIAGTDFSALPVQISRPCLPESIHLNEFRL
jgi:phosphopantetheine--protein transferase-like protein